MNLFAKKLSEANAPKSSTDKDSSQTDGKNEAKATGTGRTHTEIKLEEAMEFFNSLLAQGYQLLFAARNLSGKPENEFIGLTEKMGSDLGEIFIARRSGGLTTVEPESMALPKAMIKMATKIV